MKGMRTLKDLLPKKGRALGKGFTGELDEKTLFYIARKVLVEEYGLRGGENIIPTLYREKKLFLSARSSLWGNEVWLEKERLMEKMNSLLGGEAIVEIKIGRD
jgi:hypothetical protein